MKRGLLILMIGFILTLASCSQEEEPLVHFECEDTIEVQLSDYSGLDGCQWIFVSSQVDFAMEPLNLTEFIDAPADGLTLEIAYIERPDMASICQVGRIIEIICVD